MINKLLRYSMIGIIWILIWQIVAVIVGEELLLPTPLSVSIRLFELALTSDFYKTIFYSLFRILIGMIFGTFIGIVGGVLSARFRIIKDFFSPVLAVVRSIPVASFIILLVLWISRDSTPLIIALMMVTPIVWINVESGIANTDPALLEMAKVYKMSPWAKIKNIYIPAVAPYFIAALRSSLGMAWKAGIAAEVLLQPIISIGKMISDSKITLETTDLFAWTVVVVILSVLIERAMILIFKLSTKRNRAINGGAENA